MTILLYWLPLPKEVMFSLLLVYLSVYLHKIS